MIDSDKNSSTHESSSPFATIDFVDLLDDDNSVSDYESDSDSDSDSSEMAKLSPGRQSFLRQRLNDFKEKSESSSKQDENTRDAEHFTETDSLKLSKRRVPQTGGRFNRNLDTDDDDSSIESYEDLDVPLQQKLNDVDLSFSRKTKMVELDGPVRTIQFRKKSLPSRAA